MRQTHKRLSAVLSLLIACIMVLCSVLPTAASVAEGAAAFATVKEIESDKLLSSPAEEESVDTGWLEIAYGTDENGRKYVSVVLKPTKEELKSASAAEVKAILRAAVDAAKALLIEQVKDQIMSMIGSSDNSGSASLIEIGESPLMAPAISLPGNVDFGSIDISAGSDVWEMLLGMYVQNKYDGTDATHYEQFFDDIVNSETKLDDLTDYVDEVVNIAVGSGIIAKEDLPDIGSISQETIDKVVTDLVDKHVTDPVLKEQVTEKLPDVVDKITTDYEETKEKVEQNPPSISYLDLVLALEAIEIDGNVIFNGDLQMSGIKAIVADLPTIYELSQMGDDEMYLDWTVGIDTKYADIEFDVSVSLETCQDLVRRAATFICDHVDASFVNGELTVDVRMPEIVTDILLKAVESDRISDELKNKLMKLLTADVDDFYGYYEALTELTFDDFITILEKLEDYIDKIIDSKYYAFFEKYAEKITIPSLDKIPDGGYLDPLDKYAGQKVEIPDFTARDLINKVKEYEHVFNKVKSYAMTVVEKAYNAIPDRFHDNNFIGSFYEGNGMLGAEFGVDVVVDDIVWKLVEKFPDHASKILVIADLINIDEINVDFDLSLYVPGLSKVDYAVGEEIYKTLLLPEGADLSRFIEISTYKGRVIKGWVDENGDSISTMPAYDTVVTAVLDDSVPVLVESTDGFYDIHSGIYTFVYDGDSRFIKVVVNPDGPISDYSVAVEWYKDGKLVYTGDTLNITNVSDSGEYTYKVILPASASYEPKEIVSDPIKVVVDSPIDESDVSVDVIVKDGEGNVISADANGNYVIYYANGETYTLTADAAVDAPNTLAYTLSYKWYYKSALDADASFVSEGVSITLDDFSDSGYYYCVASVAFGGTSVDVTGAAVSIGLWSVIDSALLWSDVTSVEYDGAAHSIVLSDYAKQLIAAGIIEVKDHQAIAADTYVAKVELLNSDDYVIIGNATQRPWTITHVEINTSELWNSVSVGYTGSPINVLDQLLTDYAKALKTSGIINVTGYEQTDAGAHTATVEVINSNYVLVGEATKTWIITEKTIAAETLWNAIAPVYTGEEIDLLLSNDARGYIANGIISITGHKGTDAGNYTATVTVINPNYVLVGEATKAWTIAKQQLNASDFWENITSVEYNSKSYEVLSTLALKLKADGIITVTGVHNAKNASNYNVSIALADTENYEFVGTKLTHSWSITPVKIDAVGFITDKTVKSTYSVDNPTFKPQFTKDMFNIADVLRVKFEGDVLDIEISYTEVVATVPTDTSSKVTVKLTLTGDSKANYVLTNTEVDALYHFEKGKFDHGLVQWFYGNGTLYEVEELPFTGKNYTVYLNNLPTNVEAVYTSDSVRTAKAPGKYTVKLDKFVIKGTGEDVSKYYNEVNVNNNTGYNPVFVWKIGDLVIEDAESGVRVEDESGILRGYTPNISTPTLDYEIFECDGKWYKIYAVYSIVFQDPDGYAPDYSRVNGEPFKVTFKVPNEARDEFLKVFYLDEEGNATKCTIVGGYYEEDEITFRTSHFSFYALALETEAPGGEGPDGPDGPGGEGGGEPGGPGEGGDGPDGPDGPGGGNDPEGPGGEGGSGEGGSDDGEGGSGSGGSGLGIKIDPAILLAIGIVLLVIVLIVLLVMLKKGGKYKAAKRVKAVNNIDLYDDLRSHEWRVEETVKLKAQEPDAEILRDQPTKFTNRTSINKTIIVTEKAAPAPKYGVASEATPVSRRSNVKEQPVAVKPIVERTINETAGDKIAVVSVPAKAAKPAPEAPKAVAPEAPKTVVAPEAPKTVVAPVVVPVVGGATKATPAAAEVSEYTSVIKPIDIPEAPIAPVIVKKAEPIVVSEPVSAEPEIVEEPVVETVEEPVVETVEEKIVVAEPAVEPAPVIDVEPEPHPIATELKFIKIFDDEPVIEEVAEDIVEAAPVEEEPVIEVVEITPVEEAPVEEAPVEEAPVEEAPVEEAPVEEAPVEEAPVEEEPVEEAPVEEEPVEEAPVEEAPVEEEPVEEAPVEEAPVEEAPVEEAPVEEAPVEEVIEEVVEEPTLIVEEETAAEEAPVEEEPVEEAPVEEEPVEEAPAEEAPVEEAPAEEVPVEEAPAEETPVEEAPAQFITAEAIPVEVPGLAENEGARLINGEIVLVHYRSSFMSRLIQAEGNIQDYYTVIKNVLLSYKGVKARASWSCESFNKARIQCAKINIKGRTLTLYLALDPKEYADSKYHFTDVSGKPKFDKVPMLVKVRSDRALKYAVELIEEMMRKLEIPQGEIPTVDYHMPYETTEELVSRDLVKVILPAGMSLDENANVVKINVGELIENAKADAAVNAENSEAAEATNETAVEETAPEAVEEVIEEVVEEAAPEVVEDAAPEVAEEAAPEVVEEAAPEVFEEAAPEVVEEAAPEIAEEAAPEVVEEAAPEIVEEAAPEVVEEAAPEVVEETAPEVVEEAAPEVVEEVAPEVVEEAAPEVVEEVAPEVVEEAAPEVAEEAAPEVAEEAAPEVVEEAAPEVVEETAPEAPSEEIVADEEGRVHVDAIHADVLVTDEEAEQRIEIVKSTDKRGGKMCEINLDTICENFEDGDTVDLAALKKMKLIPANAGRLKVLARGIMTKNNLNIKADKFSLSAVKMITLAGGHAEQQK